MKVWIEQEYCTRGRPLRGVLPQVFKLGDDGLAYVRDDGVVSSAGGKIGAVLVPEDLEDGVLDAQAECAGECIYVDR